MDLCEGPFRPSNSMFHGESFCSPLRRLRGSNALPHPAAPTPKEEARTSFPSPDGLLGQGDSCWNQIACGFPGLLLVRLPSLPICLPGVTWHGGRFGCKSCPAGGDKMVPPALGTYSGSRRWGRGCPLAHPPKAKTQPPAVSSDSKQHLQQVWPYGEGCGLPHRGPLSSSGAPIRSCPSPKPVTCSQTCVDWEMASSRA